MNSIELEGVRVHNLQGVSLSIPHNLVTAVCGVSGSGKSSLAFDTLFAEGQRRYAETFSPQARQFLDQLERPDADRIEGIPPSIAIQQQRRLTNSLSTVGNRTEILRYLQLLFAQMGFSHCPSCAAEVKQWTADSAAHHLLQESESLRAVITFPAPSAAEVSDLISSGFARGIVGDSFIRLEEIADSPSIGDLQIVVDRIRVESESVKRLAESIRQGFVQSQLITVLIEADSGESSIDGKRWDKHVFASGRQCPSCHRVVPAVTQELLSFHSAVGACADCQGTGVNSGDSQRSCQSCDGTRLNEFGRNIRLQRMNLPELLELECDDVVPWLNKVEKGATSAERSALDTILRQLRQRLNRMNELGLGYLSLNRTLMTLSSGEVRRTLLTSVLGSGLINTLYVLDEPTSGLGRADVARVVQAIRGLQQAGNTVVVVEHDVDVIRSADYVVELGPAAGSNGGRLVFCGSPDDLPAADTMTAATLRSMDAGLGETTTASPVPTTDVGPHLQVRGIQCHNIRGIDLDLPLHRLCAVTGVSGSGKSSLMVDAIYQELQKQWSETDEQDRDRCSFAAGVELLNGVELLEQNPLQCSTRSIPATFLGAFDGIRKLLAETHEARKRNLTPGTFSFNSTRGGRCERCQGHGFIRIDMQFLADIEATCDNCHGRRFRADVLEVRYRDRSVDEILLMTAEEAFVFFNGHHRIQRSLNGLRQIGLGYLTLGQPLSTLSGGESQRLRIAALLSGVPISDDRSSQSDAQKPHRESGTLFILDEPSNGLHAADSERIMTCLRQLVQVGHSVVIIEHDESLVDKCDYRIVMGPGPGKLGGRIIEQGPLA